MKAAIYAQYRPDYLNPESIGDQVARCRTAAKEHGLQVLDDHIFSDVVKRTTQRKRPGLSALLAAVRDQQVKVVLVDNLTFLVSHSGFPKPIFSELELQGVRLISAQGGLDTAKEPDKQLVQFLRATYEQRWQDASARQRRRQANLKGERV